MFWILHIVAIIFFIPALFITLPLHVIYSRIEYNKDQRQKERDRQMAELLTHLRKN